LRYGEDWRANVSVIIIRRRAGGNNQVIGIIPTLEKDADQRLVRRNIGLRDRRVHKTQLADRRGHRHGSDAGTSRAPDKRAAREIGKIIFIHIYF